MRIPDFHSMMDPINRMWISLFSIATLVVVISPAHALSTADTFIAVLNSQTTKHSVLPDFFESGSDSSAKISGQPRMAQYSLNYLLVDKYKFNENRLYHPKGLHRETLSTLENYISYYRAHSSIDGILWKSVLRDRPKGFSKRFVVNESENIDSYQIGDILVILCALYRITGDQEYKSLAESHYQFALRHFVNDDYSIVDMVDSKFLPRVISYYTVGRTILFLDGLLHYINTFSAWEDLIIVDRAIDRLIENRHPDTGILKEYLILDENLPELLDSEKEVVRLNNDLSSLYTYGELYEILYFLYFLTGEKRYLNNIKELIDDQIRVFWDSDRRIFYWAVYNDSGLPESECVHGMAFESASYSLIRLSIETGNPRYADYVGRFLREIALRSPTFPLIERYSCYEGYKHFSDDTVAMGSLYGLLKTLAYFSIYSGDDKYSSQGNKLISGVVNSLLGKYIDEHGEPENGVKWTNIGELVWFTNEGVVPFHFIVSNKDLFLRKIIDTKVNFLGGDFVLQPNPRLTN